MSVLPKRIGSYKPLAVIGNGEMTTVYRARDTRNQRIVALKVLSTEFAHNPSIANRFTRQAHITQRLKQPCVAEVFESGFVDDVLYIALEYAEFGTLQDWLIGHNGPPRFDEVMDILEKVAFCLDHAHASGYIHGNIKSNNILFASDNRVLLADFLGRSERDVEGIRSAANESRNYTPNDTPTDSATDESKRIIDGIQADIYDLAAIAYLIFTGKQLPAADVDLAELRSKVESLPALLAETNPFADPSIAAVLQRALAAPLESLSEVSPADRFASAGAFVQALAKPTSIDAVVNTTELVRYDSKNAAAQKILDRKQRNAIVAVARKGSPATEPAPFPTLPFWRRRLEGSILGAVAALILLALVYFSFQSMGIRERLSFLTGNAPPDGSSTAIGEGTPLPTVIAAIPVTATATLTPQLTGTPTQSATANMTATREMAIILTLTAMPTATASATETAAATETPVPTPTQTKTEMPTVSPTATPTETATQTASATPNATSTAQAVMGLTLTAMPTATPSNTATLTPSVTATATVTATASKTHTPLPTATSSNTATLTPSATVTATANATASKTNTPLPTATPSNTATLTPSVTATATATATASKTYTPLPTATPSNTATLTPSVTATATASRTHTPTVTRTPLPTATSSNTATFTPSVTATATATATASRTRTPTATRTPLPTATVRATSTPNALATLRASIRLTLTAMPTPTPMSTSTPMPTATLIPLPTSTPTDIPTATATIRPTATLRLPTPTLTATAIPVVNQIELVRVTLLSPPDDAVVSEGTEFVWQSNIPLPEGYLFEPAFWQQDGDPLVLGRGWGGSTRQLSMTLRPKDFLPGAGPYFWAIRILDASGKPLFVASPIRQIVVNVAGSSPPSSGGGNPPPAPQPTNTPPRPG